MKTKKVVSMQDNSNLRLVIEKINKVNSNHNFITQAKNDRIQYYTEKRTDLIGFPTSQIIGYDFNAEVLEKAFTLEKLDYFHKKISHKIKGLEKHTYAPELNKLFFKNEKFIKVPQCDTIEKAITQIIKNMSIDQIKGI